MNHQKDLNLQNESAKGTPDDGDIEVAIATTVVVPDDQPMPAASLPKSQGDHHSPNASSWRRMSLRSLRTLVSDCPRDCEQPLTVFAKLFIQPGNEEQFEQWYHDITKLQKEHWPGYLSSELLKPMANTSEYISIFRYDSYEHLEGWMTSSQRHEMLQRAKAFSHAPPLLSFHSLEYWFVPAGTDENNGDQTSESGGQPPPSQQPPHLQPPPKYKMVVVTFLVIWAMNQWTGKVLLRIFGKGTLPKLILQAFTTFLTVLVAAYVGLPLSTALLGFWLFPSQPYTTSLRNGIMSLPWPIPKLVTWIHAKAIASTSARATTTTTTAKANIESSSSTSATKKQMNEDEEEGLKVVVKS